MERIKTVTNQFIGEATPQVVLPADYRRRYLNLYAKTGSCLVSFGDGDHTDTGVVIAQGVSMECEVTMTNKVTYSGADTVLLVIQSVTSAAVLTFDGKTLTFGGEPLSFSIIQPLSPPIFN